MTVVNFPRHHRSRCKTTCTGCEKFGRDCVNDVLYLCSRCDGAESSLTSDCCGYRLTWEMHEEVTAGRLDYLDGRWWRCEGGGMPKRRRR